MDLLWFIVDSLLWISFSLLLCLFPTGDRSKWEEKEVSASWEGGEEQDLSMSDFGKFYRLTPINYPLPLNIFPGPYPTCPWPTHDVSVALRKITEGGPNQKLTCSDSCCRKNLHIPWLYLPCLIIPPILIIPPMFDYTSHVGLIIPPMLARQNFHNENEWWN